MILVTGHIICDLYAETTEAYRCILGGYAVGENLVKAFAGGKAANFSVSTAKTGAQVVLHASIGNDAYSDIMMSHFQSHGIDTRRLSREQMPCDSIVYDRENNDTDGQFVHFKCNSLFDYRLITDAHLNDVDYIVSHWGSSNEDVVDLFERSKRLNKINVFNPAPYRDISEELLRNIDYLFLNKQEAYLLYSKYELNSKDIEGGAEYFSKKYGTKMVITLAEKGLFYCDSQKKFHLDTQKINALDVVGAGDALLGTTIGALDQGATIENALKNGIELATKNCMQLGAQNFVIS